MPDKLPSYILPSFLSIFTLGSNTLLAANFSTSLNFIKTQEGFVPIADNTLDGIWTVGYGSTWNFDKGRKVQQGDSIDIKTAQRWLEMTVATTSKEIKSVVKKSINLNELNALISLTYNIGLGAFKNSTLLKKLNAGESKILVSDQFLKWIYINGVISNGLKNRRIKERQLFLS